MLREREGERGVDDEELIKTPKQISELSFFNLFFGDYIHIYFLWGDNVIEFKIGWKLC